LHPQRRVRLGPCIDVECETHGENDAAFDARFVPVNPLLLLRRAQTNPNERRLEPIDFIHYFDFLILREIAVSAARDFDVRIQ